MANKERTKRPNRAMYRRLEKKIVELEQELELVRHHRKVMRQHIQAKRQVVLVCNTEMTSIISDPVVVRTGLSGINLNVERWAKLGEDLYAKTARRLSVLEATLVDSEGAAINEIYRRVLDQEEPS
jgi:hypothetical protein